MPAVSLPEFEKVADSLNQLNSLGAAAESQGMLCAMLSANVQIQVGAWVDSLINEHVETSDTPGQEAYQTLHALFLATAEAFEENDFRMPILLPSDEAPLFLRVEALSEWCEGYLTGLHLLGLNVQSNQNVTLQDALNDLIEISQVELDQEDEQDPESEQSYLELVEFVKVAVLTIAEELKVMFDHAPTAEVH